VYIMGLNLLLNLDAFHDSLRDTTHQDFGKEDVRVERA
jgi:hypothetical protein